MGLLTASDEFRPVQLFNRLENFYLHWCEGEFIDVLQDNHPQKKMSQLQGQGLQLGVRQVDVHAGLNVMILLLELCRYAQQKYELKGKITFYLCGQKSTDNFNRFRLLSIINYSYCISAAFFKEILGPFFSGVILEGVALRGVYLLRMDLSESNLNGVDLTGADLRGANFSNADLRGANLSYTNLCGSRNRNRNLKGANFRGTNLSCANFTGANLENIFWNEDTNWEDVQGLETAVNVPEALKQQLGLG